MRINLWAGPGAGKSTIAPALFSQLKQNGYNIELTSEYIKRWAYEGRKTQSFDQLYICAKQLNAEDVVLRNGVEHIITDSPVPMQCYYATKYNFVCTQELINIAKSFEQLHPSINIFLDRGDIPYQQNGRYENYEQALEVDKKMYQFMQEITGQNTVFKTKDFSGIYNFIIERI